MKVKYKKYNVGGIIGGAAQAAIGIGQSIYGMQQAKRSRAEIDKLQASAPSLSTPSEYYNALKQAYDQSLVEMQYNEMNRQLATTAGALQQAGGRALVGGLNQASRQTQYGMAQLAEQQNQRQVGALSELAGAREREVGRKEDRNRWMQSLEQQNLMAANEQIGGGLASTAEGLFYGGMGAADEIGKLKRSEDVIRKGEDPFLRKASGSGGASASEFDFNRGGITKGKFDHKTNPIDLVQSGKKVGEVTGGEAVLNPSQQERVKKESPYFAQLMKQFKSKK
jgi:hypothetical protein